MRRSPPLLTAHPPAPGFIPRRPSILPHAPYPHLFLHFYAPPARSEEFKRHKKANAKFVATFFTEWGNYAATLERQAGAAAGELGVAMDPHALATMSPEQQDQLQKLREEARKLA